MNSWNRWASPAGPGPATRGPSGPSLPATQGPLPRVLRRLPRLPELADAVWRRRCETKREAREGRFGLGPGAWGLGPGAAVEVGRKAREGAWVFACSASLLASLPSPHDSDVTDAGPH